MDEQRTESPRRPRPKRRWRRLAYALLFILVVCAIRSAVADWNDVLSRSMEPAIIPGDRLLVNKVAYQLRLPFTDKVVLQWTEPERGDVVVFQTEDEGPMIKRVIGLPGDVISLRKNRLMINNHAAWYEPYDHAAAEGAQDEGFRQYLAIEAVPGRRHPIVLTPGNPGPSFFPVTVPQGHVYVLGDNRDNSMDSRFFGPVPINRIIGRVSHVVISLDYQNGLKPRWNRFWTELP